MDVIECELDDDLSKGWILEASFDCLRSPDYIVDLGSLAFLVVLLSDIPER